MEKVGAPQFSFSWTPLATVKKKRNFAMGLSDPWSRPEIQSKNYEGFGGAYDDDKYRDLRKEWEWER